MKIAIPLAQGKLSLHFGHCEEFALLDVNAESKEITNSTTIKAPPHEPGLLPKWLAEKGATCIIAGGMGQRAQDLFTQQNIGVVVGAPSETPENIVKAYLDGTLTTGSNLCDH
jgi:predicted Fe-Mo cluster-binding NifX family protein